MLARSIFPFLTCTVRLAAFGSLLGQIVQAAEDGQPDEDEPSISDIFIVKTGTGAGSCDGYMDKVTGWFKDSMAIASAPITVASNAVAENNSPDDFLGMKYLATYFLLPPQDFGGESRSRQVLATVKRAKAFMEGTYLLDQGKPWLYCGDGWAVEQEWTDEVRPDRQIIEDQQELYTVGTQLWGIFLGYYTVFVLDRLHDDGSVKDPKKPPYKPWWVEDLKQYFFAPSSTGGNPCRSGQNLGSTMSQTVPNSVTLCFDNDHLGRPEFLSDTAPVIEPNQLVQLRRSVSLTLYHEILHLAIGPSSEDYAYDFIEITGSYPSYLTKREITMDESILNPESYTLFALAAYLGEQYPDYVFWNGWSRERSA